MITFKRLDAWLSVTLILVCGVVAVIDWAAETLMISYCIIGLWQVISMLIHSVNSWFMRKGGVRNIYHWLTVAIFITGFIGWLLSGVLLLLLLYGMLFISPMLAIFYTAICFAEVKELRLTHSLNLK